MGTGVEWGVYFPSYRSWTGSASHWSLRLWPGQNKWLCRPNMFASFRIEKWDQSSSITWWKGRSIQAYQASYEISIWLIAWMVFLYPWFYYSDYMLQINPTGWQYCLTAFNLNIMQTCNLKAVHIKISKWRAFPSLSIRMLYISRHRGFLISIPHF